MNNKAVIFCRVSSKEQEESGYSLPSQEKLLTEYSQSKGLQIDKVFSLSESAGGSKQRKLFGEMLEYLKTKKIKNLIVEKTDRLTRNIRDAVLVNDWIENDEEKQVHFVKENFILHKNSKSNEKFIWNIKVSVAQYYLDNLSEEVKKGQKEKIAEGWLPTKPPYGYKTIGEQGHKIHVVDEEVALIIKKMFELYGTGIYSILKLSKEMHKLGLRGHTGKLVPKSRIHRLLNDPFYIGDFVWKGEIYKGKQQPIIDRDLFEKVQRHLRSKNTPKYSKHDYNFKGAFRCHSCHGVITWEEKKGIMYGHCNHYRGCPKRHWHKEKDVLKIVGKIIDKFKVDNPRVREWLRKALKETNSNDSEFYLDTIRELEKSRKMYTDRLSNAYIDKLDGKISEEEYNQHRSKFEGDLKELDSQIAKQTEAMQKSTDLGVQIYEISQNGKESFYKLNPDKKRQLLKKVFVKLELDTNKILYTLTPGFKSLLFLAKRTNSSKIEKLMDQDNKIFELYDLGKVSKYYASLEPECSALLPN
jgi:DNA invertase Pin-like site-specific DNA recombinase